MIHGQIDDLTSLLENCQCLSQSKQSTLEETYDDLLKYKTTLLKKNFQLKSILQKTQQNITKRSLGLVFQELQDLSKENQTLRAQCKRLSMGKKPLNVNTSDYNNQNLATPKSKKCKTNVHNVSESQFCENVGRKSLKNKENMRNSLIEGRCSLGNQKGIKKENQLTERKNDKNCQMFSECSSMKSRASFESKNVKTEALQTNVFLNMINLLLEEEKVKEKQFYSIIEEEQSHLQQNNLQKRQKNTLINELEKQIFVTQENITQLTEALETYQDQITTMKIDISSITKMTKQLYEIKKNFLQMQSKCQQINELKKQIALKECQLETVQQKLGQNAHNFSIKPPQSIKMMLRMFGIDEQRVQDASNCKVELRKLVAGRMEKPQKRKIKIKEIMDGVREGRKKFKELLKIYNGKIQKIEGKITYLKAKEGKKQKQIN